MTARESKCSVSCRAVEKGADYKASSCSPTGATATCSPSLTLRVCASSTCNALSTTEETYAFTAFGSTSKDFGLPLAIRTDNSVPFASAHALSGLSKLSVWWLSPNFPVPLEPSSRR